MTKETSHKSDSLLSKASLKQVKPILIKVLLGSVGIAGLVGILALLFGEFSSIHGKIIATVILTAALSVGLLIYLSIDNTRYRVVGVIGVITSLVAFTLGLLMIWTESRLFFEGTMQLWRAYALTTILSIALAHSSLMTRLLDHPVAAIRTGILATIVCSMGFVGICAYILFGNGLDYEDSMPRLLGVFGILIATGTIILPVWARIQKK